MAQTNTGATDAVPSGADGEEDLSATSDDGEAHADARKHSLDAMAQTGGANTGDEGAKAAVPSGANGDENDEGAIDAEELPDAPGEIDESETESASAVPQSASEVAEGAKADGSSDTDNEEHATSDDREEAIDGEAEPDVTGAETALQETGSSSSKDMPSPDDSADDEETSEQPTTTDTTGGDDEPTDVSAAPMVDNPPADLKYFKAENKFLRDLYQAVETVEELAQINTDAIKTLQDNQMEADAKTKRTMEDIVAAATDSATSANTRRSKLAEKKTVVDSKVGEREVKMGKVRADLKSGV